MPHRGNIIHNVLDGALEIARLFIDITRLVERMAARTSNDQERRDLAATALQVRYPNAEQHFPALPDQLLSARRHADFGNSLWLTYNVVQDISSPADCRDARPRGGRAATTWPSAIREDVRINVGLWNHAMQRCSTDNFKAVRPRRGEFLAAVLPIRSRNCLAQIA